MVGEQADYELVWMTVYRFHQRIADRFRVGRAFLAGDAAHLYSPFGARGLNSGAPDAENLAWKLARVLRGEAPDSLLDTYADERRAAAEENLAVTDATMRFMVPHGPWRRLVRNLTLRGSERLTALRRRVNSGRLAEPFQYAPSGIVEPGPDDPALPRHGAVAPDLVLGDGSRLKERLGGSFVVLVAGADEEYVAAVRALPWPFAVDVVADGALAPVYASSGPRGWVVRPDGHLAGSVALDDAGLNRLPALVARGALGAG